MSQSVQDQSNGRYSSVATFLHWLIAVAIFGLIGSGFWMTGAINVPETQNTAFEVYQIHKSFGLSVLVLVAIRLLWRVTHRPPQAIAGLTKPEVLLAHLGHLALYALMVGVPLLGWAMVSASVWGLPTIWFGLFEWPHLPWFAELDPSEKGPVEEDLKGLHALGAYAMLALVGVHMLAAFKHSLLDSHPIFYRIVPWLSAPDVSSDEGSQS